MRGGRVAEGGHDFPEEEERLLHRNRETLMHRNRGALPFIYCWYGCTEIEEYDLHLLNCTAAFNALKIVVRPVEYGLHKCCTKIEVRSVFNCCTEIEVRLHLFCTVFEEVRLGFNAVWSTNFNAQKFKCTAGVLLCTVIRFLR